MLTVYTDGSCKINQGVKGAWGFLIVREGEKSEELCFVKTGYVENTTNNRMELQAILEAVKHAYKRDEQIIINTDSEYCIKCYNTWLDKWNKQNDIKNNAKNADLWEELFSIVNKDANLVLGLNYVRGHSGDKYNELIDKVVQSMAK